MKLIDTVSGGSIGVYSLESDSEIEAMKHILTADVDKVKPTGNAQNQFAESITVLFPGASLQAAWDYADVAIPRRKDGEALISGTPSLRALGDLNGANQKYVDVCVTLPKELDRREQNRSSWFGGKYGAGTLVFMETAGSEGNIVYATLNISRFYGVCEQHEMDIVTPSYRRDVVDDIVDKLGEQQQDPSIRSPIVNQNLGGAFVSGFAKWEDIVAAYDKARSLIQADGWSRREWDAVRRDSLGADNPVVREQSAERYKARLTELVSK